MPRQYLQINDFSGGINTKSDQRSLENNQLTVVKDMQVYNVGQIYTGKNSIAVTSRGSGTSTAGHGAFLFKADNDISNNSKSIELLAIADVANGEVDIIEDPFNTLSVRDTTNHLGAINLGSTSGGKFVYYFIDGALRVADGAFGANNRVQWYGHIDRSGTIPGGAIDSWVTGNNDLVAPTGANITTSGGSTNYAASQAGFDIDITTEGTDDDGLWEATTYEFAQSYVYEGDQESLLTKYSESITLETNEYFTSVFAGLVHDSNVNDRIKGGRIYIRKKDSNDLYTLFLDINFERGVRKDIGETYVSWSNPGGGNNWVNSGSGIEIKSPSIDTYESINRFSPDVGHISFGDANGLGYKDATICNMRTFVCHVNYYTSTGASETKLMPDRILFTPIGKYDTFPPNYFLDIGINDGEDFTAIESFGTRLLAYKESTLYVINVASQNDAEWFLESTHKGLGVDKPSCVVKTEFGVCWARKTGIYAWAPDKGIVELSAQLSKNSIPMSTMTNPTIGYYAPDNQLLISLDCSSSSSILVYDFPSKSFVEFQNYHGSAISNIINNVDRTAFVEDDQDIKEYNTDWSSSSKDWSFETKDFTFGNPAVLKKIQKIIVSYETNATGVTVSTSFSTNYRTDSTFQLLNSSTWDTAATGGVKNISATVPVGGGSAIGTCSSLKLKFNGSGSYKITDVTVVYRTRVKEPASSVS